MMAYAPAGSHPSSASELTALVVGSEDMQEVIVKKTGWFAILRPSLTFTAPFTIFLPFQPKDGLLNQGWNDIDILIEGSIIDMIF
jgi:hypothetical protein